MEVKYILLYAIVSSVFRCCKKHCTAMLAPGTSELKHITPKYAHAGKYHEIQSGSMKTAQRLMLTMMTVIMMMLALMTRKLRNVKSDCTSGTSCASNGGVGESHTTVLSYYLIKFEKWNMHWPFYDRKLLINWPNQFWNSTFEWLLPCYPDLHPQKQQNHLLQLPL